MHRAGPDELSMASNLDGCPDELGPVCVFAKGHALVLDCFEAGFDFPPELRAREGEQSFHFLVHAELALPQRVGPFGRKHGWRGRPMWFS